MWRARLKFTPRLTHPWYRDATMVHGIVSTLIGQDHRLGQPNFTLWHDDGDWQILSLHDQRPACLCPSPLPVNANGRPVDLLMVGIQQVETPRINNVRGKVLLSTKTPLVITTNNHTRSCTAPAIEHIIRALQRMVDGLKLGLNCEQIDPLQLVSVSGIATRTVIGGHVSKGTTERGVVIGWMGSMVLDCSPLAVWLLRIAAQVGLGGARAYGFGRLTMMAEDDN